MSHLLEMLFKAEKDIPDLLRNRETKWVSTHVVYEEPHVHRLHVTWRENYRLSLHRIFPCTKGQPLFHVHPWPQAAKLVKGRYEMGIGAAPGVVAPPIAVTALLVAPTAYAMGHPDAWHYVRPLDEPVLTFMLTAAPWQREVNYTASKQPRLSPEDTESLLAAFRAIYL